MIFVEIFASILTNCMVTLFGVGFWQKVGFNFDIVEEMYFRVTSLSDQARYFRGNVLFSI